MKKLAGLLVVVALGGVLLATPAAAVDVPSSSSLTAGPLAEAAAATGSTSTPATSTPTSPTPAIVGECHDANGNDIPCSGTGGGSAPTGGVTIPNTNVDAASKAALTDAQNQAAAAKQQAETAITANVLLNTADGRECIREFQALSSINRGVFGEKLFNLREASGSDLPTRAINFPAEEAKAEQDFKDRQDAINANLAVCLAQITPPTVRP